MNNWEDDYRQLIGAEKNATKKQTDSIRESVYDTLLDSAFHHKDAQKNGTPFPVIGTRKGAKKVVIDLLPGTQACIGDTFYLYDENWLCVDIYKDEFEIMHGELWLCNHTFRFTEKRNYIIEVAGIIDDGSYSVPSGTAIPAERNKLVCYLPFSEQTAQLFVDKRIALGRMLDKYGNTILEVGVISWIDLHTKNYGAGSHLMMFGLSSGVYNPEVDNINEVVCDCRQNDCTDFYEKSTLHIQGRGTMRIGTQRTYKALLNGESLTDNVIWGMGSESPSSVTCSPVGNDVVISVPFDENLIGSRITLICNYTAGHVNEGVLEIEVVSIG